MSEGFLGIRWGTQLGKLNGQGMQPTRHEIAERIIHKAVLGDPCLACESLAGNTDSEMGACASAVGTHVARMGGAFVLYLQHRR